VTAAGKIYAIFGSADLEIGGDENRATPFAADESEQIERRGYALNRDGWIEGLSVLGVPVWQGRGAGARDLVAVMALAAASPRFERLGEEAVANRLLEASAVVGARLSPSVGAGRQRRSR
jgi:DNA-binding IclR family transcriptional regulator